MSVFIKRANKTAARPAAKPVAQAAPAPVKPVAAPVAQATPAVAPKADVTHPLSSTSATEPLLRAWRRLTGRK